MEEQGTNTQNLSQGLRGYDVDGVLYPKTKVQLVLPFVVISGRAKTDENIKRTKTQLLELGITVPFGKLFLCPDVTDKDYDDPNRYIKVAKFKAKIISELKVFRFFEDEERQMRIIKKELQRLNSFCEVRMV